MVNFKNQQDFIDYQIQQLNFEPNISLVVSIDTLDEILEGMDFDYEYSKEINSENYIYVIDKNKNAETGQIFLFIEPLNFNGEGCLETIIENDICVVQKYLLDEDDLEEIWCDEIIIISYDNEDKNFQVDCTKCNGCDDEQCICFDNEETEESDLISVKLEFVEDVLENFGVISFVTDYKTALELNLEYEIHEYDYIGIDLQSDVQLYLVDIIPNEIFVIEPLKRTSGFYHIETEELIIDGEIEDELTDEFFNFVNADEISVVRFIDENDFNKCSDEINEEVDELIDCVLEDIENGECTKCSLIELYKIAFEDGRNSIK